MAKEDLQKEIDDFLEKVKANPPPETAQKSTTGAGKKVVEMVDESKKKVKPKVVTDFDEMLKAPWDFDQTVISVEVMTMLNPVMTLFADALKKICKFNVEYYIPMDMKMAVKDTGLTPKKLKDLWLTSVDVWKSLEKKKQQEKEELKLATKAENFVKEVAKEYEVVKAEIEGAKLLDWQDYSKFLTDVKDFVEVLAEGSTSPVPDEPITLFKKEDGGYAVELSAGPQTGETLMPPKKPPVNGVYELKLSLNDETLKTLKELGNQMMEIADIQSAVPNIKHQMPGAPKQGFFGAEEATFASLGVTDFVSSTGTLKGPGVKVFLSGLNYDISMYKGSTDDKTLVNIALSNPGWGESWSCVFKDGHTESLGDVANKLKAMWSM